MVSLDGSLRRQAVTPVAAPLSAVVLSPHLRLRLLLLLLRRLLLS
jgi:hypothetical protein